MPISARFSQLSGPRQALVRLCQFTNFGLIRDLLVKHREPILANPAVVLRDIKLDSDENQRKEITICDFQLCAEVSRLMALLDLVEEGTISSLEVRAGIPRRITFENPLSSLQTGNQDGER